MPVNPIPSFIKPKPVYKPYTPANNHHCSRISNRGGIPNGYSPEYRDLLSKVVLYRGNDVFCPPLIELLPWLGLAPSKKKAKKLINNGDVYINEKRIWNKNYVLTKDDITAAQLVIIKTKYSFGYVYMEEVTDEHLYV